MKKILAFGDSVIKGVIYENSHYHLSRQRFTDLLEERLNISIDNKGQMGSTVTRLEKALEHSSAALNSDEYEAVVLEYGGNDCDYDWQAVSDTPDALHFCRTEPQQFCREYRERIMQLRNMGKQVLLLSLPPIDAERYFRFISRGRNAEAILNWLDGDIDHLRQWHEMYNLAVFQLAAETQTRILDITSCFLARPNYSAFLCDDGIHPNQQGHRLIADAICAELDR